MKNTIYVLSGLLIFVGFLIGFADVFPLLALIMVGVGVVALALNYEGDLR